MQKTMKNKCDVEESSASVIARQLYEQKGITRSDITGADLSDIYRGLAAVYPPASFSLAEDVLIPIEHVADDQSDECWGVIVETREHPALETVISSVLDVCEMPVQLFHGISNLEFIMSTRIAAMVERGQVALSELKADHLEPKDYNGLLMLPRFWQSMSGRGKILVFQTDSVCCSQSRYTLKNFYNFDYIGCNWSRQRPVGLIVDGGNGGFSLRDWSMSVKCLASFDPSLWPGGEDGYFAFHMELMGARVASHKESGRFGTQTEFLDRSFGAHQIGILKPLELEAFIAYCPEAKTIFPDLF